MIFVHSGFRTGSTYLWSCLRRSPRTVAYYEIFHEILDLITPAQAAGLGPSSWPSRHPPGAPYFLEFLPLIREGGGVDGFEPAMSYHRFIPSDGCGAAVFRADAAYAGRLIGYAESQGRIPVLTAARSLGRVRGLKAALPGLHLLLYRNLFHQWCSITSQAQQGNPYFVQKIIEVTRLNGHDRTLDELRQLFPVENASVGDENTFYTFLFLHLHLYVQAAGAVDLVVDLNRLERERDHRAEVEACLAGQDVEVDLSGAKNSITYSVCRLGSAVEVRERLKVIGDLVIDRAPDEAGRSFGAKILAEFSEEWLRHEFHAGALRSVLLGPTGLQAQCDMMRAERDVIITERNRAAIERDGLRLQQDALEAECDAIRLERDGAVSKHHALRCDRDAALATHDAMCVQRDRAVAERDALQAECDAIRLERDGAANEHHALRHGRDAALAGCHAMREERDAAWAERDAAHSQVGRLAEELATLRVERERLLAEQTVRVAVIANRTHHGYGLRLAARWLAGGHRDRTREQMRMRRDGDKARDVGNWAAAAAAYERYLNTVPADDMIWVQYGHALKEAGDLKRALIAYERSLLLNPSNSDRDIHLFDLRKRISDVDSGDCR